MNASTLQLRDLTLQLGDKRLCGGLTLDINAGQSWGLLGRNGAGKTTLLHCLMGIHQPVSGQILLDGVDINRLSRRQRATQMGMLFQEGMDTLPATVMETVMLGRHPHNQSLLSDSADDQAIARKALQTFDLMDLADRQIETLSGGEQQRLALAMLITQQPEFYLLDEPSNHLDVAFQIRLLSTLENTARQDHASLLMATHDINLAARFCEHIILLLPGGEHIQGMAADILTAENLSRAYECRIECLKEGELTLFYPARETG